jgi:hypothetical protein
MYPFLGNPGPVSIYDNGSYIINGINTTLNLTIPIDAKVGDLLLYTYWTSDSSGNPTFTFPPPTGFTSLSLIETVYTGPQKSVLGVCYRYFQSGDTTFSTGAFPFNYCGIMLAVKNVSSISKVEYFLDTAGLTLSPWTMNYPDVVHNQKSMTILIMMPINNSGSPRDYTEDSPTGFGIINTAAVPISFGGGMTMYFKNDIDVGGGPFDTQVLSNISNTVTINPIFIADGYSKCCLSFNLRK